MPVVGSLPALVDVVCQPGKRHCLNPRLGSSLLGGFYQSLLGLGQDLDVGCSSRAGFNWVSNLNGISVAAQFLPHGITLPDLEASPELPSDQPASTANGPATAITAAADKKIKIPRPGTYWATIRLNLRDLGL
ncbi:uncharacterized protein ATNIH1004_001738 [Aspergillus tanneri]|uniref:Uncharacterized protein n=1 Tax=Aspergillus tanneri TaxID=1220188 RepID=A0A5M9N6U5_9EURO|nr:uncharacterized protein ATNIH1004_001738 [Aspergillus tanneri]KAA8652829.1 hypothetical protein ATNIH1004_001738 [Aspergillus tanneri]